MTQTPYPIDSAYTALSLAYRNPSAALIAERILPRVLVASKTFRYRRFQQAQAYTVPATEIARSAYPRSVELFGEEKSASVRDYALEQHLPNDEIQQARAGRYGFDPVARAIEQITDLLLLDRERRVAGIVQDPGNYQTLRNPAAKWNSERAKPLAELLEALDQPLLRPNTLILGQLAWTALATHPQMLKAVAGSGAGIPTPQQLAGLLGIDQVLIGRAFINTAAAGADPSYARIWGPHAAMLHINPVATTQSTVSWGYSAEYGRREVRLETDARRGARGATTVWVVESLCELVTARDAGLLFQDVI